MLDLIKSINLNITDDSHETDNCPSKKAFHKGGKAFLRKVAKALGLKAGTFDVRSCYGGPATAGEVILHTDTLYVNITQGFRNDAGFARTCQGRKDYSGGRNIPIQDHSLKTVATFIDFLKAQRLA